MAIRAALSPVEIELAWGDRVLPEAPAFDIHRQTPTAAAGQIGPRFDRLAEVPLNEHKRILVLRHVPVPGASMFVEGELDVRTRAKVEIASQGLSLVTVRSEDGVWRQLSPRKAPYNRRVTGSTVCKVTGPLYGHAEIRTKADPGGRRILGVIGLTRGGTTPWSTVIAGERLLEPPASWATADGRFGGERESQRFGWMVEIDPVRPHSRPRKLTMLGRMDHAESATTLNDDDRVVVTMVASDGQWFRFVSKQRFDDSSGPLAASYNRRLLSAGTVSVRAKDGSWVPLTTDRVSAVPGLRVADVLLDLSAAARLALAAPLSASA
ncbi:MAG: alkaline phosphatase PhoX [Nocardioides sp.]|jgi:secreted PhoX family phosphatase